MATTINEFRDEAQLSLLHDKITKKSRAILDLPIDTPEQRIEYVRNALQSIQEILTSPI